MAGCGMAYVPETEGMRGLFWGGIQTFDTPLYKTTTLLTYRTGYAVAVDLDQRCARPTNPSTCAGCGTTTQQAKNPQTCGG